MKKMVATLLTAILVLTLAVCPAFAEVYTGTGAGFGGDVTVEITVEGGAVAAVTVTGDNETPGIGGAALEKLAEQIKASGSAEIDGVSGATLTSNGAREAAAAAFAAAAGETKEEKTLAFTAGTYTGTAAGYNGPVSLDVTFSDAAVTDIQIKASGETAHVGSPAFDYVIPDIIAANGTGVDVVSGATFTSRAIKEAVNDAAAQAGVTDLAAFRKNTIKHEAGEPIVETYDVVVVGGGGAGMGAAAQSAQNGNTVVVVEKNAEIGGNTTVSGGAFQSVMPYLVWDPANPDATEGVYPHDGKTYAKVKSTQGCIDTLRTILNWSEEPFDADYYKTHEYVAGDIDELSKHGVHADYLPTLQALKAEIKAYLDWADPQLAFGKAEGDLTLFSTINLHIFQTYYGGLRSSADGTEWIYGDFDLVSQFINDGQGFKEWLEDQGSVFSDGTQTTLIGALWYRENDFRGGDLDGDGVAEIPAQFGAYFAPTRNTVLVASPTAKDNKIMLRTTADSLIIKDGKVIGVNATRFDGTPVTLYANKGVVLATGGYAANIAKVVETNKYWDPTKVTLSTKTTNRSSLQGDGIRMGEEVGAGTTGEGWTQMMPISWIDNGNLAFGAGTWACYINPTTGKRFVNESAERDVLSLGEFANGIEFSGSQGVFMELSNATIPVGFPYPYDDYSKGKTTDTAIASTATVDNRVYCFSNEEELQAILDIFGMKADPKVIYQTLKDYDAAIMAGTQPEVAKSQASALMGTAQKDEKGNYLPETYTIDGVKLRIRIMAPSAHHTMGGLTIDTQRHVLTADGEIIKGLYAAGEVTGGIHGGNRLGGNAIVEIFVSGRTAANTIDADNK